MISSIISRLVILLFGTLYPAYASYKAVRTKNLKEYVKWMMYWIVFALFTCIETFTDVFLSWFPFYYEIKIILVIWLLSPATKGSSILYRKFVHPTLSSKEQEIDDYIAKAKEQSYKQVLGLGSKGVSALVQTAIKGGGGLVNQLKKSYSLSDLSDPSQEDVRDETDDVGGGRLSRRRRSPLRSSTTSAIYFSEVDVRSDRIASIQSAEDISSGYSSGEGLYTGHPLKLLPREGLQRTGSLTRSRTTRVTRSSVPKKGGGSDDSDDEIFDTNIVFYNDQIKDDPTVPLDKEIKRSTSSETEFFDTIDSLHGNFGQKSNAVLTACVDNLVDSDAVNFPLTTNYSTPSFDINVGKVLEEKLKTTSEKLNCDPEDVLHLLHITKDVSTFSDFIKDLIQKKSSDKSEDVNDPNVSNNSKKAETIDNKDEEVEKFEDAIDHNRNPIPLQNVDSEKSPKQDLRGGKYNKKAAPAPPPPSTSNPEQSAIKAKLVLQPGLVKNVKTEGDLPCKEVFINSPKSKRRSLVKRSHSSLSHTSSSASTSSKTKQSLSKLIKFPKKIGFWNRDDTSERKPSWPSFLKEDLLKPSLSDSKLQSKSDNNLSKTDQNVNLPLHGTNLPKSGSLISIKSLPESPLAHRRLKIIRRYVDDDID